MLTTFLRLLAACLLLLPVAATAADRLVRAGDLVLIEPWIRQVPPAARVGGAYVTIINGGEETDRLVGGSSPHAERVEIHDMEVVDGVMRMAPVEGGLAIGPGETVQMRPGGYHIMLMGLKGLPARGEEATLTLTFEKAGDVTVTMSVAAIGAREPERSK